MAGPRERLEVLEGKGRKHLTKAEKAQRAAGEAKPEIPKQIRAPNYLPEDLRPEYVELGKRLRDCGLFTVLDADVLARYLMARRSWLEASRAVFEAQKTEDLKRQDDASRIQDRFFKQCQRCASDLGLTVTSRCRLVLPESKEPEENPFEAMLRERQEARSHA